MTDDKCCECVYVSVDVSDQLTHVVKIHGTRRSGKEQDMEQMGFSDEPVVKKNPAAQATSLFAKKCGVTATTCYTYGHIMIVMDADITCTRYLWLGLIVHIRNPRP